MPEQEIPGTTHQQSAVAGVLELLGLDREVPSMPGGDMVFTITPETAERISANVGQRVIVDASGLSSITKGDGGAPHAKPK